MGLFDMAVDLFRRIPVEKVLFPPPDNTKALSKFMTEVKGMDVATPSPEVLPAPKPPEKPREVAQSGPPVIKTREGVDAERMAWQDGIIRGELWLLEGHLKNNCLGCGGDVECCWKHTTNTLDAVKETRSMTTEPLYREAAALAERILPYVNPEDVRAQKYADVYPALTLEVSQIRTQFDKRVMGSARAPITLEEAKALAAEQAAREVERKWHSQETKSS